jgi:capsid protein
MAGKMAPLTYADYLADPWKWTQCFWQPPGWDWVDPLKDAKAAIELHKMNMLSLKDHYGSKGKNWEREVAQIAIERERLKEIGLEYIQAKGLSERDVGVEEREETVD